MKKLAILFILLIFLAACAKQTVQQTQTAPSVTQPQNTITITGPPVFKLIQSGATKSPPVISGIVENTGNGSGSVKVTANVFYAKVVSEADSQILTIKPQEKANFSINISKIAQWVSYNVTLEPITT